MLGSREMIQLLIVSAAVQIFGIIMIIQLARQDVSNYTKQSLYGTGITGQEVVINATKNGSSTRAISSASTRITPKECGS